MDDCAQLENPFRIDMLGGLALRQGSLVIRSFRTQKTASLLAYLAFHKNQIHPRDVLIELYWPNSELEAARTNLSVALNALRRRLEGPGVPPGAVLIADRSCVRLNADVFSTDVEEFRDRLNQAESETQRERRAAGRIDALDLYLGDLLPGFYCDWVLSERDSLRDRYLLALKQTIDEFVEARDFDRAIEFSHRMVRADPLHEPAYHNLMRLYLITGRAGDALDQYQVIERLLRSELQTTPSAPVAALATKLRAMAPHRRREAIPGQSSSAVAAAVPETTARIIPDQRRAARVPVQFTRCFGREAEIALLTGLLRPSAQDAVPHDTEDTVGDGASRPDVSLVTLTGPGGIGKTRLAIEVARRLAQEFTGGVQFVRLVDLRRAVHLAEAVRDALELPRQSRAPALDQIVEFLCDVNRPFLLVLDNFEQIAAAGASVVWTLLNRVPQLKCLVTSRQALALPGEREIPVTALPTPDIEPAFTGAQDVASVLAFPSVALFVDRAQAYRPEFQITASNAGSIASICHELEGIPLAIELAAARARVLSPSQIFGRLKGQSQRSELLTSRRTNGADHHSSLHNTMDWSYQLLPAGIQQFFARLSVFQGGWDLEASENICKEPQALDYLSQLRSCSLVVSEESSSAIRFRMLETLRRFANEKLTPDEQRLIGRRHAAHYCRLVTDAPSTGAERVATAARFEEDLDNLRAALDWSLDEYGDIETGLRIAGALFTFWRVRGHFLEGRDWYARLLERAPREPTEGLTAALYGAGALASLAGEAQTALGLLERCRDAALELELDRYLALATNELGSCAFRRGDFEEAQHCYTQYLSMARSQGAPEREASALTNLASVAQKKGDFATSRRLNMESLILWRQTGERAGEARTLHNLANLALSERQLDESRSFYEESLEIKRELDDHYSLSITLAGAAEAAILQGDQKSALKYGRESMTLAKKQNFRASLVDTFHILIEIARSAGENGVASRMYAAMEKTRAELNYPFPPAHIEEYQRIQSELRTTLGEEIYAEERTRGAALSLNDAVDLLENVLDHLAI